MDEDAENSVLLKAIKLYLHQVVKLKLKRAQIDPTGLEDKNSYYGYSIYDSDSDDEGDKDGSYSGSRKTLAGTLSRFKISKQLPENEWHDLGTYGKSESPVVLRIERNSLREGEDDDEKSKKSTQIINTTFHFTSPGEDAIDNFIDTA